MSEETTKTTYTILGKLVTEDGAASPSEAAAQNATWEEFGTIEASNAKTAVKAFFEANPPTKPLAAGVAVAGKSWQPEAFKVETKTVVTFG